MAGEDAIDQVTTYLSRLMGEPISADQPVRMRSVHRAAFTSWARKQNLPVEFSKLASDKPFTIRQILSANGPDTVNFPLTTSATSQSTQAPADITGQILGIGIDIEDVDALPQADDYREHAFFRDNFTPAEIAYCIRQADVRASLCGTWAAKEAVLKAGIVLGPVADLKSIEIKRDALGRPTVPRCSVSISHTSRSAVAVCVANPVAAEPLDAPSVLAIEAAPAPVRTKFRNLALGSVLSFIAGSALTFALHAWPASHQVTVGHGPAGNLAKPD